MKSLRFLPTESDGDHELDKTFRLDLAVELDSGERVLVEIQMRGFAAYKKRAVFYVAHAYINTVAKATVEDTAFHSLSYPNIYITG